MRRVIRFPVIFALGFGGCVLLCAALFLQDAPLVQTPAVASPEDVAATQQLVRDLRVAAAQPSGPGSALQVSEAQLNSAVRVGARFVPGFRGRVRVAGHRVVGDVSIPIPFVAGRKWLNISGWVPEFDQKLTLGAVTVGRIQVAPALALGVVRIGANLVIGNGFGDKVVQAASAMQVSGQDLTFHIALDDVGRNGVMRSVFGSLRGQEMPDAQEIESYHLAIRAAMADGRLSQTGSFLPYVQFTLAEALHRSTEQSLPNALTAALFGLAKACGARDFAMIVGSLAFDVAQTDQEWPATCENVTLNGRIDSRRHFITASALQAASNRGFSVPVGEFKELYDTISGAGGFDFTDLAANNSGIRMSDFLIMQPIESWPALLARIRTENSVIIPFEGIPSIMPEAEFKAQFKDVDSFAYAAMLSEIEARIDRLDLYQAQ